MSPESIPPVRTPHWMRTVPPLSAPSLVNDIDHDVVIVGGGLTGLWAAHYLLEADPSLTIAVLEAHSIGHGASGRNGGWLSNLLPGHEGKIAARYGKAELRRYRDAVRASVDESIRAAEHLGIDADVVKNGSLSLAFAPAQAQRQREAVSRSNANYPEDRLLLLTPNELRERVRAEGVLSATFNPHVARIHPGKLVIGLARSLQSRGVEIYENSTVTRFERNCVHTAAARAHARWIVRATEGFTTTIPGAGREFLSMNSSVMITKPQSESFWNDIGWAGCELLSDGAHDHVYGQRTPDGRVLLGGRGVPYRFKNGFDLEETTPQSTLDTLTRALTSMFPTIDPRPDDSWSGVLAVARDWNARISVDKTDGFIAAGGYVGHGVSATNLAGRTIADIITDTPSELVTLPWVGHSSRSWEPEPLRWIGARSIYVGYRLADRRERRSNSARTSAFATISDTVSQRY